MDEQLTRTSASRSRDPNALEVLIISDGRLLRFPLPASGAVTIGRSSTADISTQDDSISRAHAEIDVGPPLRVRDLGSKNGTEVRGVLLGDDAAVVRIDEPFILGDATAVIQALVADAEAVECADEDAFRAEFERVTQRASRMHEPAAIIRVHPGEADARQHPLTFARELRPGDAFLWRDNIVTAVIGSASEDALALTRAGLAAMLAPFGGGGIGVARYPDDGRDLEALIARANSDAGLVTGGDAPVVSHALTRALFAHAAKVARGDIPVLILGETGSGKEVVAEAVHRGSPRASQAFVRVNCAALSEGMLESELFGHATGAFNGATGMKLGAFERAAGGSLFLEAIGELPPGLQARLMEVLESGRATRMGDLDPSPVDARILAASSRDLGQAVADGAFRRDLFYRLSAVTLEVPPLRERLSEVAALADRFLAESAAKTGRAPPAPSDAATRRLSSYQWPGNVRELRNVIEHSLLLCDGDELSPSHIAFSPGAAGSSPAEPDSERERIARALDECAGNQTRAARLLGMSRRTLCKRLDEYGMPRPQKK